jgi:uncharacterized protein (DUF1810 family)
MSDCPGDAKPAADELARFRQAQEGVYTSALRELRAGQKRGHWMWFIFPQLAGLGQSSTSRYYALAGAGEAQAYLADPVLGPRLMKCTAALLALDDRPARQIFGELDAMKFSASMTLFAAIAGSDSLFAQALETFFAGERHQRTLELLGQA